MVHVIFAKAQSQMKEVDQITLLNNLAATAKRQLDEVKANFNHLDKDRLEKQAVNGGWNIIQCLAHLNTYSHYYHPQIETALNRFSGQPATNFRSGWWGAYFIKMMDPAITTKSYRAAKRHIPLPEQDAQVVIATFIEQQEKLLGYLQLAAGSDLNAIQIPTSINKWIRLKLGDVFQFLIIHTDRHLQQADRNLRNQC